MYKVIDYGRFDFGTIQQSYILQDENGEYFFRLLLKFNDGDKMKTFRPITKEMAEILLKQIKKMKAIYHQ